MLKKDCFIFLANSSAKYQRVYTKSSQIWFQLLDTDVLVIFLTKLLHATCAHHNIQYANWMGHWRDMIFVLRTALCREQRQQQCGSDDGRRQKLWPRSHSGKSIISLTVYCSLCSKTWCDTVCWGWFWPDKILKQGREILIFGAWMVVEFGWIIFEPFQTTIYQLWWNYSQKFW